MPNDLVKSGESKLANACFSLADVIVMAVLLGMMAFTFGARTSWVVGHSMNPTLTEGQFLLVTAIPRPLEYGDIVVVSETGTNLPERRPIVKRVIGLPGDEISIDFEQGVVYRNGSALREPYTASPTYACSYLSGNTEFPCVVPEGRCFLMGDNRGDSMDSRARLVGMVDQRDILGVKIGKK